MKPSEQDLAVDEIQTVKFRGGKLSMLVLGAAFFAVFATKFVPSLMPGNYSGLGSLSEKAVIAMGCIDFEGAAILSALYTEVKSPVVAGEAAAREFVMARHRGEMAAGNLGKMGECADELVAGSERLAKEGAVQDAVVDIGEAIIEVYSARALALSIAFTGSLNEDGTLTLPNEESYRDHEVALASLQESWNAAEKRITALSAWIGEKTAYGR